MKPANKALLTQPLGVLQTPDGSATVWSSRYEQHYHSRHGALTQSRYVYLNGTHTDTHRAPKVLEIGFGVGMNFLTTLGRTAERNFPLHYVAYEFDPLPVHILRAVGATHPAGKHPLWLKLLEQWPNQSETSDAPGEKPGRIKVLPALQLGLEQSTLEIHFCDASHARFPALWATAVYLDGFSPNLNPEVWTPELAARLYAAMQPGAWLATYSAAGPVRRALAKAGLRVTRREGIAGKRECLKVQKPFENAYAPVPLAAHDRPHGEAQFHAAHDNPAEIQPMAKEAARASTAPSNQWATPIATPAVPSTHQVTNETLKPAPRPAKKIKPPEPALTASSWTGVSWFGQSSDE